MTSSYGQQNTSAGSTGSGGGAHIFTTEVFNASSVNKQDIQTVILNDVNHIRTVAAATWAEIPINTTQYSNPGFTAAIRDGMLLRSQVKYTLRNQSNETEVVTAYHCTVRKDEFWEGFHTLNDGITKIKSVYDVLGQGFAENGLDPASAGANNAVLSEAAWTPFQSPTFCRMFKITKVRTSRIKAGEERSMTIKKRWSKLIPDDIFQAPNNGAQVNWNAREFRKTYLKGAKFVLFVLKARIAAITPVQEDFMKEITFTTPTVIMLSEFRYQSRYLPTNKTPATLIFAPTGIRAPAGPEQASIIRDSDMIPGPETEAAG